MPTSDTSPDILFATIAAGGAHVSSAQAMAQALETHYPGRYQTQVSEIMQDYGFEALDKRHKEGWRWMLSSPRRVNFGQKLIDSVPQITTAAQRFMLRDFAQRAAQELSRNPPKLVVSNHGWLTTALTQAQRRYGLEIPVLTFVTVTLDATSVWAEPKAEQYIIGAQMGKRSLMRLGIPEKSIGVIGYPVKQAFMHTPSKAEARRKLGLEETPFTCLVALGGEGVGHDVSTVLDWLETLSFSVQPIVIAGRNEELESRLRERAKTQPLLHVEGFVDNMQDFMAASDTIIGKVSSATTFEALAVGRPTLATQKTFSSENRFIDFLSERDLGRYTPDQASLTAAVEEFATHPQRLEEIEARCQRLAFPDMARRIAQYLAHYADTGKPDPSLYGPGVDAPLT